MVTWTKAGQVYDALQEHFGIGSWTDDMPIPFWRYRATEVSKIGAMMKKRNISFAELHAAFEFAKENGRPITESWHLFALVVEAARARRERDKVPTDVRAALDAAAAEAHDRGLVEWQVALMNADAGEGGKTLLAEWKEKHGG